MFVCACKSSVDLWVVVDIKWWRHRVMQLQLPQQQLKRISSSHRRSTQRFEVTDNPLRPFRCRVPNYHNNVSARLPVPVAITQWQHYGGKIEGLLLPKNPLPPWETLRMRDMKCSTGNEAQNCRGGKCETRKCGTKLRGLNVYWTWKWEKTQAYGKLFLWK